jgi:hypothetical protein
MWGRLMWSEYDKHMYSRKKFYVVAVHDFTYPELKPLQIC